MRSHTQETRKKNELFLLIISSPKIITLSLLSLLSLPSLPFPASPLYHTCTSLYITVYFLPLSLLFCYFTSTVITFYFLTFAILSLAPSYNLSFYHISFSFFLLPSLSLSLSSSLQFFPSFSQFIPFSLSLCYILLCTYPFSIICPSVVVFLLFLILTFLPLFQYATPLFSCLFIIGTKSF